MNLRTLRTSWKWNHTILVLLHLAYFTEHNVLRAHPWCSMLQNFILFYGCIIFCCRNALHLLYPSSADGPLGASTLWLLWKRIRIKWFKNFFNVFKKLIYFNWRLITLQYCGDFCYTSTWLSHGCTCVPPSWNLPHISAHPIPLGCPRAPALSALLHASNLHWSSIYSLVFTLVLTLCMLYYLYWAFDRMFFFESKVYLCFMDGRV